MTGMMGKLKEAQKKVEETKERLHTVLIDMSSHDEKVKVTITVNRTLKTITIDDALLQDKDMLKDYLIRTIIEAIARATKINETEVSAVAKKKCLISLGWICLSKFYCF
jgi:DNA-binding protein YbaB